MKRLLPILLALPGVGCAYAHDRARDFADVWRIEAAAGVGLQVDVGVGELAHLGLGSSRRWSAGLRYGEVIGEKRVEDHLPLSVVWSAVAADAAGVHQLRMGDATHSQHRCDAIVPGELLSGTLEKDPIHYWDIEARVFVGVIGVEVGFSPGQFVDFLLGWFGVDIGDDDGPKRASRRFWQPIEEGPHKRIEPPPERPPPPKP